MALSRSKTKYKMVLEHFIIVLESKEVLTDRHRHVEIHRSQPEGASYGHTWSHESIRK